LDSQSDLGSISLIGLACPLNMFCSHFRKQFDSDNYRQFVFHFLNIPVRFQSSVFTDQSDFSYKTTL